MAADDLNTPLGLGRAPSWRMPALAPYVAGACALALAGFGLWISVVDDPLGGEPIAVAMIERPAPLQASTPPTPQKGAATMAGAATQTAAPAQPSSGPLIIKVPPAGGRVDPGGPGALDPALVEVSTYGPIPRIAADGRRALDVYARPSGLAIEDARPKVAILVEVSASGSDAELNKLPRAVTLAFPSYSEAAVAGASAARRRGHEIMLRVPMEPFDAPAGVDAVQTLLTTLPAAANVDRLKWLMSRFDGYFGLVGEGGAAFTTNETALMPVLNESARRGLAFLDGGIAAKSLVTHIGPIVGAVVANATPVMSATSDNANLDAALAGLEQRARLDGHAIGTLPADGTTLERLRQWAEGLEARGIVLVPVSTLMRRANPS